MPRRETNDYYRTRERAALAMAQAASESATRNIHLELAKRYVDMVSAEGMDALISPKTAI